MAQYKGWSIGVTLVSSLDKRWGAQVRVWPSERLPQTHSGIHVHFSQTASDRTVVQNEALAAARRYIDASLAVHQ